MAEDVAGTTNLFEIIKTTRSMRRLKQDPVPDALIRKVLEAGVCAPSGGNMQRWRFLVIRDATIKQTVGAYYKRAWDEVVAPRYRAGEPAPGMDRDRFLRLLAAAEHLAAHIHDAPVWIVPCLQGDAPTRTLKAEDATREIPIIVTSAYGPYADKAELRECGCDAYMATPIQITGFIDLIHSFLSRPATRKTG